MTSRNADCDRPVAMTCCTFNPESGLTFAPLGPHLVTSDLVGDPNNLRLECRINGEQRQDWTTNDTIFNCRQLISFASRMMTIKPGGIMFTGTPHGLIFGKPKGEQVWLTPGDREACSVEKLGELAFSLA